ncbi:bifunctional phosphopantothenoylcysteine decarboxylase/phosphopantothenate--cysteine ligase CoaBC [Candidatus Sumerlaeota bacterium]|nr:bifunctional phosphopantothenoylcysteine decarboxylase/phosphopantothenate--cysteine ligase CoaBC [Candidatus Sumerlaeota bacterium]
MLEGKYILLGVSSSVACYKSLELIRLFRKAGAEVRVIMTENATRMITPLEFEAISQNPVYSDVFSRENPWEVEHISAADWGDVYIVAPATANIIAKMAHGIADDAPTTLYLAFGGTTFVAPAMHTGMWFHPSTQENITLLQKRGVRFIGPDTGGLASGDAGIGRMSDPKTIFETIQNYFICAGTLGGKRVLVTAGPTREPIDPVRFISNRSSGKMGYALAEAAAQRGAEVTLISGPTLLPPPPGITTQKVVTAQEMLEVTLSHAENADIFILTAAVSDYRPDRAAKGKIKKEKESMNLNLVTNPDIAREIGKKIRQDQVLVGFAAETSHLKENAMKKLKEKNFDMIVANDVSGVDTGMESDHNAVALIFRDGTIEETERLPKPLIANIVLDGIEKILRLKKEE